MVRDLNFPVEIVSCPIVREADGLALSSRNAYLNPEQRKHALALHRSLLHVEKLAGAGESSAERLAIAGKQEFVGATGVELDYFEIVNPETLDPVENVSQGTLVAVAAYVGATRLIDNLLLNKMSR
jgi:pantoate--beta-alanine ligase